MREPRATEPDPPSPLSPLRRAAARCWARRLVRIYKCLPLRCPRCVEPMRVITFGLGRPVIARILGHIGVSGGRGGAAMSCDAPSAGRPPADTDATAGGAAGAFAAAG